MTTYGILGTYNNPSKDKTWRAVQVCSDAYPSGLGYWLHLNYWAFFNPGIEGNVGNQGVERLVEHVIDHHPNGWGSLASSNWLLPAWDREWTEQYTLENTLKREGLSEFAESISHMPSCIAKDKRPWWGGLITNLTRTEYWCEWAYIINRESVTVDVFLGRPRFNRNATWLTVNLNSHPDEKAWGNIWSFIGQDCVMQNGEWEYDDA